MKRTRLLFLFLLAVTFISILSARGGAGEDAGPVINVYCYDSFSSEWGPGPAISEAFYKKTGIRVEFNAPGDAVTVLNQLILEKGNSRADVAIGLDNSLLNRALEAGILDPYNSPELELISSDLIFDDSYHLLPFDYGHFAICYDSEVLTTPPSSLEELTTGQYEDSLVLMDPRTSTPGLGFLLWTVAVYGDEWPEYWRRLKPSILTIADGWSQGYTLFTAGEAPMVLSYGTSPVYHAEYEGSERYRAAEFNDGHIMQLEGMGIVSGTENRSEAEAFIDFMLGDTAQNALAMSNIMLPVNNRISLPESFYIALRPQKTLALPAEFTGTEEVEKLIDSWTEIFSR